MEVLKKCKKLLEVTSTIFYSLPTNKFKNERFKLNGNFMK